VRTVAGSCALVAVAALSWSPATTARSLETRAASCDATLFWVQVEPQSRSVLVFKPITLPHDRNGHVTMDGAVLRLLARIGPSGGSLEFGQDCRRRNAPSGRRDASYLTSPFTLRRPTILFCHGPPEERITLTVRSERGLTRLSVDRGRRRILTASSGPSRGGMSYDVVNCSREEIQRGAG
jgi:hypothetical protein